MSIGRICILTPSHLATNPRLVKEARALTDAGYEVRVIYGRSAPWAREHDISLIDPRWQTSCVAFGPFEATPSNYALQAVRRHTARLLVRLGCRDETVIATSHAASTSGLSRAALESPADLYIAHYVAALPAAALAAHRHGARYAFDAEDFHLGDLPEQPRHKLEKLIIREIEGRYLPGAAYVTAAAPMIADAYARAYPIPRPTVVLNTFPRVQAPAASSPTGSARPGPSLYWFSQTIGPGRGLEVAIRAIARASSAPHLYLRGTPASGYERALRVLATNHGVGDRLHFLPPVAPTALEMLGAQYDLGYVGEQAETCNRQIAITNKVFSYLSSGLPVIASDIPSHKVIASDLGEAIEIFSMKDASALAGALDHFLLDPSQLSISREYAWQLGQTRYCWEAERHALLNIVNATLTSTRASDLSKS